MQTMKKPGKLLAFSLVTSFLLLLICSKCSPLYPFNDWVDVHCFLTVGRGIKHGLVPYRDLYEQKGPLLYFLVAIATLFSETSFLPLFMMEVVFYALYIFESMKIVLLWTENKAVYLFAPFVFMTVTVSLAFYYGFSAEELCLPFLAIPLQIVLTHFRKATELRKQECFIIGICAAASFWIKYVFCGFFVGLVLIVSLWHYQERKNIFNSMISSIAGFFSVTIPILGWYAVKGGLKDLFQVYFYNNIMFYPGEQTTPVMIASQLAGSLMKDSFLWAFLGLAGIVYLAVSFKNNQWEFLTILATLVMIIIFITMTSRYFVYYSLLLALYTPLVLIPIGTRIPLGKTGVKGFAALIVLSITLAAGASYAVSPNTYMIGVSRKSLPQYVFAEIMHDKKENPTLLNYEFLDGGFYYAAGILPINRFSCKFNIYLAEQIMEQKTLIEEGKVDFVVTRERTSIPGDKYQIISSMELFSYPDDFTYYLFERM